MKKPCGKCKRHRSKVFFSKKKDSKDRLQPICKDCEKEVNHEYYLANKEKVMRQVKMWSEKNPQKVRAAWRKYSSTRYDKQPEKIRPRQAIHAIIWQGKLIRPTVCSTCNTETFIEAHHPDYGKPLEVIWLCRSCHRKLHKSDK